MAIAFPLNFPAGFLGMSRSEFDIGKYMAVDPMGIGDLARDLGPDLWTVDYRTGLLSFDQVKEFRAWLLLLEDGLKTFYGYDFRTPYTTSYPNGFSGLTRAGGGAFTGAITITAVNSDNKTMTLGGFPQNFTLNRGDAIAFDYDSGRRAYHQFMESATSTSLGAVTAISVLPAVRPGWAVGQAANIDLAKAKLRLVPKSKSFEQADEYGTGYWSFKAIQSTSR